MKLIVSLLPIAAVAGWSGGAFAQSAYVFAGNAQSGKYTADAKYAHNPSGQPIRIDRSGTGQYTVTFVGLGGKTAGGNVQVSGYGASSGHCNVERWSADGADFVAKVRCWGANGRAADARFSLMASVPAAGSSASKARHAFTWAGSPDNAAYTADARYTHNPGNDSVNISKKGVGHYDVRFGGLAGKATAGGNVQVTAYGVEPTYCKVERWSSQAGAFTATVRCFNKAGRAADSKFSVFVLAP